MNNGYLGMVRQWQTLFYNNRLSSVALDCFPDAEKLAGAYGFKGRTIDKPQELASALETAFKTPGPYLLNVTVVAHRKRVSDGARRRRDQRNGAGTAATGGGGLRKTNMLQIISILLENKPGALLRVTGVLSARGYNIESLTVAQTLDPELSRMTIMVDVEERLRTQVIKQMNKLVNVLQATDMTESPSLIREMVLLRVRCPQEHRTAVLKEAEIFQARVVDSSVEGFAIEATGEPEKLDEFIDVMRSYGEIDVSARARSPCRSKPKSFVCNRQCPPARAPRPFKQNLPRTSIPNADASTKKTETLRPSRAKRSPLSATAARAMRTR